MGGASAVAAGAGLWLIDREQLPAGPGPESLDAIGAEPLYLEASEIVRRGSSRVFALRLNGGVELVPHHFQHEKLPNPLTIEEWQAHLEAPVVFNAGQFDENLSHLGLLKQRGEWIVPQQHGAWQGLLLSGPEDRSAAWARVADLDQVDGSAAVERYRNVVQSMMLFDDQHRVRVRDTDKSACRTVVAEDTAGRLILVFTEGAVTLADLAGWLQRQGLGLVRAMNLDGGIEAQLAVRSRELSFVFFGQYGTGTTSLDAGGAGIIRYPLPAVISVQPVGAGRGPAL